MLDKEFKDKWITALRSGNYKQTSGVLYDSCTTGYCCLGVAAKVMGREDKELDMVELLFELPNSEEFPTELLGNAVKTSDGIYKPIVARLVTMNDDGIPFTKIADYIEENL